MTILSSSATSTSAVVSVAWLNTFFVFVKMARVFLIAVCSAAFAGEALAQVAARPVRSEEKQKEQHAVAREQEKKAQRASVIELEGERSFGDKELRAQLKEPISTIDEFGLTPARADDAAFFLELFYRKHGYVKAAVHYVIEPGNQLRLKIDEGALYTLGNVTFDGNAHETVQKLFDYVVGPTRERYSKLQKSLPFVSSDVEEGTDLVHRLYVAEGYLDAVVEKPVYTYHDDTSQVDALISIQEGREYSFGNINFSGNTVYGQEALQGQIKDILSQPYTEARLADIPRRLQSYYKTRGYYAVKVEATGDPATAGGGRVPVQVAISTGPLYHFGDVTVTGLQRLHPSYVTKRFTSLSGTTYSPEVLDEKFRTLMRSGLFNLLQINPVAVDDDTLRLDISAEEAKSRVLGLSAGYGTYEGLIGGISFREQDLFGSGRPLTTSVLVSQRSYKGEILYEDPYWFDSDFDFKARLQALTFDFDGYSKFELGGRLELTRKLTKQYEVGAVFSVRHVEITSAEIKPIYLGPTSYFVNTLGFTQTLDLRDSPLVEPRGFIAANTVDVATSAFGSDIELVRVTLRLGYYIPFAPKPLMPGVVEDSGPKTPWRRFYEQSSLAFGARVGSVHSLNHSGPDEATTIPIDERFFNGGGTTVRSFGERDLGPLDRHDNPLGGEFYTVFNAEYTFPIFGELQGALFTDAGNLLPTSEDPGLDNMRYAIGFGLRYKLPIGPIRLDYGVNPDPHPGEDFGAFHFSFGFAF
jgi:outer membrane protein insertion porin family